MTVPLKGPYTIPNLFSDKVSHRKKHLSEIPFSNDIWFLSCVKRIFLIVFVHHLLSKENEKTLFNLVPEQFFKIFF